ncbi:MAG: hypothetical protein K2U26_17545 [Cyclobacteriaceae bacterium]|nr:hypothetical protein [Cyclobacteriaceae bacterium]
MKNLSKFYGQKISTDEMKKINGGAGYCNCQCTSGPGAWTGYYANSQSAQNAVSNWCANGAGGCQCFM